MLEDLIMKHNQAFKDWCNAVDFGSEDQAHKAKLVLEKIRDELSHKLRIESEKKHTLGILGGGPVLSMGVGNLLEKARKELTLFLNKPGDTKAEPVLPFKSKIKKYHTYLVTKNLEVIYSRHGNILLNLRLWIRPLQFHTNPMDFIYCEEKITVLDKEKDLVLYLGIQHLPLEDQPYHIFGGANILETVNIE